MEIVIHIQKIFEKQDEFQNTLRYTLNTKMYSKRNKRESQVFSIRTKNYINFYKKQNTFKEVFQISISMKYSSYLKYKQ